MSIYYIHNYGGKFTKSIYDTTMMEYKAVLKQWDKETGGGPGLGIYFESWDPIKFTKYNLDLEEYDHTQVTNRPPILIDSYHQDNIKKHTLQ